MAFKEPTIHWGDGSDTSEANRTKAITNAFIKKICLYVLHP